jgi:hypothetical protein
MQERFLAKKQGVWMAFVDLEKAFDMVPRDTEVITEVVES